jgi:dynactin complex subunit
MAESSGVRVEERVLVSCREGKTKDVSWEKGTVRYVGTVRDQAGEWLGIEWDNPTRG